ncbi:thermostable hemolysin [Xanthomonas maliensis]|uniref:thermostable hemolysin n=1 Tax=Xanthomonas maliensis TaxID=1321368 RepID=UPI00039B1806|nr:thermostable hemolysin [Xanthomonas maliensis]KAB7767065.1 thermostable hemolysin [Xanthomonas maliensis]
MSWIPLTSLVSLPGRFAHGELVGVDHPQRASIEGFIADVYLSRYGARLQSFLPHLLAYRDANGHLLAAVGLKLGGEGGLFVEQYLDVAAEASVALELRVDTVGRGQLAEVGNFAAVTPGVARELIMQLTCLLQAAQVRWVLFVATRQLRNACHRLQLAPVALAEASAARLEGDVGAWGRYYDTQPRVMCGDVAAGHAYLMQQALGEVQMETALCMAVAQ